MDFVKTYGWLFSAALLSLLPTVQGQPWVAVAPLLQARQEVGSATLNDRIYVVGGFLTDGSTTATAEMYDPGANRWRRVAPMPTAVNHPAAAAVDGKLYVIGGYRGFGPDTATDAVQIYDPAQDSWSSGAPLLKPRGGLGVAVIGGKIYAVGGANVTPVRDTAVYDPAADRWLSVSPMPTARDHLAVGAIGGKVFALGGRNQQSFTLSTAEVYDPNTDHWAQVTPLSLGRSGHAVAAQKSCLYVFGGEGNNSSDKGVFREVEAYNPVLGKWVWMPPMPTPRHGMGAATLADRIYLPGGAPVAGFGAVRVHDVFVPAECTLD